MSCQRVRLARILGLAALALVIPEGHAQVDCARIDVGGVRPGMTVREVRTAMGGRADRFDHRTVDGAVRTTAVYARAPYSILVKYDGEVTRRASSARVEAVEQRAEGATVDAAAFAEALVGRLGATPDAGPAPFSTAEPSRWRLAECGLEVVATREAGAWWNPNGRGSLVVRLSSMPLAPPATEAVVVARRGGDPASGATGPAPDPSAPAADAAGAPAGPVRPRPARDVASRAPDSSSPSSTPDAPRAGGPLDALRAAEQRPPRRIERSATPPTFPALARRLRLQAEVTLDIVVRRDGSVGDVVVARSTLPGYGFEDAAVEAVRGWRYEPALRDGRPIEAPLSVVVAFR